MISLNEKLCLIFFCSLIVTFSLIAINRRFEVETISRKLKPLLVPSYPPTEPPFKAPYFAPNIAMIHIPKTAGTSFYEQHKKIHKFFLRSPGPDEKSFMEYQRLLKRSGDDYRLFTFFRKPKKHVYSMYLECKYDWWGKHVTKGTKFPRIRHEDVSKGITPGFDLWLKHFIKHPNTTDMFKCYHPFNMQTRYMMSKEIEPHNYDMSSHEFNDVTKQRIKSLWFFGLTEYYSLTVCAVDLLITGYSTPECNCTLGSKPRVTKEKRITHGVPPHPYKLLSNNTKDMVNSMIQNDVKLYDFASDVFFGKIKEIEKQHNIKLCFNKLT